MDVAKKIANFTAKSFRQCNACLTKAGRNIYHKISPKFLAVRIPTG